jgi:hypothetical protein
VGDSFDSAWWLGRATRLRQAAAARRGDALALMSLDETLDALGRTGSRAVETDEGLRSVPVDGVVGTLARAEDFDRLFRPRNRALRDRWRALAAADGELPPVRLVRLGEMYVVEDGHHRIALARARGARKIRAEVRSVCTIAWAMRCLTPEHLPSKKAERMFLERVPLADADRTDLWLDDPADWFRLADSAEAWGFRQTLRGRLLRDRAELAGAWWCEEVRPLVARVRNQGLSATPRDIGVYVSYGLDHV